jgi:hypothetical protein
MLLKTLNTAELSELLCAFVKVNHLMAAKFFLINISSF